MPVEDIIRKKPKWVKRQISDEEARLLSKEIQKSGAVTALEIGCASGFSSAIIYEQLIQNSPDQGRLYGFDVSENCYYDKSHKTGDALWEIHGKSARVKYQTGLTSARINGIDPGDLSINKCDFAFIDANHRTPWPAFDMMSLARFLEPHAVIAIHDVDVIFHAQFRDCNGSRDLFRAWLGEKWRYKSAPNIAFMRRGNDDVVAESIANSLMNDWDESINESRLRAYRRMARTYGRSGALIQKAIDRQLNSARSLVDARLSMQN